jgi:Phage integrase, N-terminal SAM-like domain
MSRITVGDWSTRWLQGQSQRKPLTRERYRNIVRVQILPEWERVRLSAITHADVVAWVSKLVADGYAASTVRQVHRVFSLMLDRALRDGRLARNAAVGVRLPRAEKGAGVPEPSPGRAPGGGLWLRAVRPAAGLHRLGLGQATAVRVNRVDLMKRRIEVMRTAMELDGQMSHGTPKTHQRRSVPLPGPWSTPWPSTPLGKGPRTWSSPPLTATSCGTTTSAAGCSCRRPTVSGCRG